MKNFKKLLAVILAAIMVLSSLSVVVFASDANLDSSADTSYRIKAGFYSFVDKVLDLILKALNAMIPGLDWGSAWPTLEEYTSDGFMSGDATFSETVGVEASWYMGYSKASLLTGLDVMDGTYYLGGALEPFTGRAPEAVIDDQQVVAYALSDGETLVVHAVIDCFGISRGDVIAIRNNLADWVEENNVTSIQISSVHQHSCIDTLGLAAPLVPALLRNPLMSIFADRDSFVLGTNKNFMANVYKYTESVIKNAVARMDIGEIYVGDINIGDYIKDKREPINKNDMMTRIRFVPACESANEIWIVNVDMHDVTFGAAASVLSADYPYYVREALAERGVDCVYVIGAELAITPQGANIPGFETCENDTERAKCIADALVAKLGEIENDERLDPILNIASKEVQVKATNGVLKLAVRQGLINVVVAKDGTDLVLITEIGYMELGNKLGVFLAPGENDPQMVWGEKTGELLSAEQSWNGTTWTKTPIAETADVEKLIVFGLANDQIGYIVLESDVHSILTENEEILCPSYKAAEIIVSAFENLIADVK
ncbi:MAG TPA: hypothetical protein GXZ23_04480 [Clostridiales bacterium]|nr:hypothetical protein [Clostridiales bacterium]